MESAKRRLPDKEFGLGITMLVSIILIIASFLFVCWLGWDDVDLTLDSEGIPLVTQAAHFIMYAIIFGVLAGASMAASYVISVVCVIVRRLIMH